MAQTNKLRFFHTEDLDSDRSGWRQVYPLGPKKYEWKKDKSEVFYRQEQKGGYTFVNKLEDGIDDFEFFNSINNDQLLRCVKRFIVTEENCGGTWRIVHIGKFTMNNGKFNLDKCKIEVKQDIVDEYSCLKENKKEKFNILGVAPDVTVFSPVQNNFEFLGCRNKEFLELAFGGLACNGTGGWKKFFTKIAFNSPQPRTTIYNESVADDYVKIGQGLNHAFWIRESLGLFSLEIYRFADSQILSLNFIDIKTTGVFDNDMVGFTANNLKNLYAYRPDANILTTIVANHPNDIIWFDVEDVLNEGYAFFYDDANGLYAYDFNTGILKFVANVDISIETATLVPTLNISYGDGLLSWHNNVSKDLMSYNPLTFISRVVENVNNVKFIVSEDGFLTWFNIDLNYMNLQRRDDTTFEIILLRDNQGDCRYSARENEWIVFDDLAPIGAQIVYNLITLGAFSPATNGGGAYIPPNLVYKIENGWFLQAGQTIVDFQAHYLDSRNPSILGAWYSLSINVPLNVVINAGTEELLDMSAGVERIYISGKASGGGVQPYEIYSVDQKDASIVLVESLGLSTDIKNMPYLCMNNCEQVLTVNKERVNIYKENIQRDDELTVWFRESIKTICVGTSPVSPGAGWILYYNQCNQFGTATWVKAPVLPAPPLLDIAEGGCLCTDDVPDFVIDADECISLDPNATTINLLMLPNTAFTSPQIRGFVEAKQPLGAFPTVRKWYIENPRDGSTYTWSFPGFVGETIITGQGTPIIEVQLTSAFPITNVACQEVNPCSGGPVPLATLPFIYLPWNGFPSGACTHNIPSIATTNIYSGGSAVFIGVSFPSVSGASSTILTTLADGRKQVVAVHNGVALSVVFTLNITGCVGLSKTVPVVAIPSADIIVTPLEVCPNGLQTYSIPTAKPVCAYTWSVDSPCFIVGPIVGTSVVIDMNGAVGTEVLTASEVCPITPVNYQLIAPCDKLHSDSWWWIIGQDTEYDNARLLKNVIEELVKSICPDIKTVRSDFFQWNPLNPSLIHYVYGGVNEYNYLTISQKSDIRNPGASENATIGNLTWETFAEWMRNIEVYYIIIDEELHLEHISRFKGVTGLDLTQGIYPEYAKYQNSFSYAKIEMSRIEEYSWMEALNADFVGFPIEYKDVNGNFSLCVSDETESHEFADLTTDLKFIQTNPGDIDNNGFVILANTFDGVNYNVIQNVGLIGGVNILNSPMSIAILQDRFMRWNRILIFGNLNRQYTIFDSSQFFKKQEKFKIPLCCDVPFSPLDLVLTELGKGELETAEIDYENDSLEIKLKYE